MSGGGKSIELLNAFNYYAHTLITFMINGEKSKAIAANCRVGDTRVRAWCVKVLRRNFHHMSPGVLVLSQRARQHKVLKLWRKTILVDINHLHNK